MAQSQKSNVLKLERGGKKKNEDVIGQIEAIRDELKQVSQRLNGIESDAKHIGKDDLDNTTRQLRNELLDGLRMLGERVSRAIQEMESRFEAFQTSHASSEQNELNPSESISETRTMEPVVNESNSTDENTNDSADTEFGSLKEPALAQNDKFEIITKSNVAKLAELFRKQSESIKRIVEVHQQKFTFYEHQLTARDEISEDRFRVIEKRMKLQQWGLIGGFIILCLIMILYRLF
ncbi:hypothetical protein JW960_24580 [candidate division KSB1 bacterium]|nr:hypothetical protein [candidate division KSB1 bacterium]